MVVPNSAGQTTMDTIQQNVNALPDWMSPLKLSLQALVKEAGGDISRFRTSLEMWYDDQMDRVSGWYKRHVAVITLVVGALWWCCSTSTPSPSGARCTPRAPSARPSAQ
jgi:hypothetical protein